jgi:hypothetical protein
VRWSQLQRPKVTQLPLAIAYRACQPSVQLQDRRRDGDCSHRLSDW